MFIQFLWHGYYPWEVRIEKFIEVFQKMNIDVGIINRNVDDAIREKYYKGTKIQRIGACDTFWSKAINYPLFCNPVFLTQTARLIQANNPSLLLVRDLPLGAAAILIGKRLKIPVVLDMAENYPAALVAYQNPAYKPFLISDALLPRLYEKYVIRNVDRIIVVSEENAARLVKNGAKREKIVVVNNTPRNSFISAAEKYESNNKHTKCPFDPLILYIGKIDIHRGIETMIRSFPAIQKRYPKSGMVLVGDGKQKTFLEELTKKMGVAERVHFTGWVNHRSLPDYIKNSTICCIPHLKCEHTDTTIPNKLFDYMAFSKPVIASNLIPVERIIREVSCGEVFNSDDIDSFYQAFVKLYESPDIKKMGENGARAVHSKYNWAIDSRRLRKLISELK